MNNIIKKRTIRVDGMTCGGCEQTINNGLKKIDGIQNAKADKKGKVYVEYDLRKVKLSDIENKITELGYKIPGNVINTIRTGWRHFTEQNELDNHTSPSRHCCSVDDGGHITPNN